MATERYDVSRTYADYRGRDQQPAEAKYGVRQCDLVGTVILSQAAQLEQANEVASIQVGVFCILQSISESTPGTLALIGESPCSRANLRPEVSEACYRASGVERKDG